MEFTASDSELMRDGVLTYRVAQKRKPLPNDQKIVLKPVNEIRFVKLKYGSSSIK